MAANIVYRTTAMELVARTRVLTDVSAFYGIANVDVIAVGDDVRAGELYNLFSTIVGDEPFLPTFGCDLPRRVFEPITGKLMNEMILDVYLSARTWLPDVAVLPGQCRAVALPGNRLAGVVAAYAYAGSTWHLPVYLTSSAAPLGDF